MCSAKPTLRKEGNSNISNFTIKQRQALLTYVIVSTKPYAIQIYFIEALTFKSIATFVVKSKNQDYFEFKVMLRN